MRTGPEPLVETLAALLERTYDIERSVRPVSRFLVGDEGHRRLIGRRVVRERVDRADGRARLLLRPLPEPGRWAAAVYLPDALVALLEAHDPRRGIDHGNIGALATLVEEVDHLVTFADRAACGAELSLLELEWHAGVSTALVARHLLCRLARRPRLPTAAEAFVEHTLFGREPAAGDPEVAERYRQANRLARGFVRDLYQRPARERLRRLRRFHRASHHEKLRSFAC
jgi:hypothetical protein